MQRLDKIKNLASEEMKTKKDPRSEIITNQDAPENKIGVGEEVQVRGTKRICSCNYFGAHNCVDVGGDVG
jgi:hypothetical protein